MFNRRTLLKLLGAVPVLGRFLVLPPSELNAESRDWPSGEGPSEYDAMDPLILERANLLFSRPMTKREHFLFFSKYSTVLHRGVLVRPWMVHLYEQPIFRSFTISIRHEDGEELMPEYYGPFTKKEYLMQVRGELVTFLGHDIPDPCHK